MMRMIMLLAAVSYERIWAPPVHHTSELYIMIGMVTEVARWCRVPGDPLFRFVMWQRRQEVICVVAEADVAWVLKLRCSSIHIPRALMHCLGVILVSYSSMPFVLGLLRLLLIRCMRCMSSDFLGVKQMFR